MTKQIAPPRFEGLDALRGFAIGLVMLRHAYPQYFAGGGIVGVTVFFGLSGFLITGVLQRGRETFGRINFASFYINRALRLYPALIAMLVIVTAIEGISNTYNDRSTLGITFVVSATYTTNIPGVTIGPLSGHLWTLATEEQFYLLWPLIIMFAGISSVRRRRVLWFVCALSWLGAVATVIFDHRHLVTQVYILPSTWAVTLVIGGMAYEYRETLRSSLFASRIAGYVAAVALGCLALVDLKGHPLTYILGGPLIAACSVVLVLNLTRQSELPRVGQSLRLLGIVSYAAYLWNWPITEWMQYLGTKYGHGRIFPGLAIPITVVVAALSWVVLERPVRDWRQRRAMQGHVGFGRPAQSGS